MACQPYKTDLPDAQWAILEPLLIMEKIYADQGYTGVCGGAVQTVCGWEVEVIRRNPEGKSFVVQAKRWVVERTFAWLLHKRRLNKDYEQWLESSESMIYLANIRLLLRRLTVEALPIVQS